MKKPLALSDDSVVGRIHAGMRIADIKAETMMARRRPTNCDKYPMIVPPTQAPVFIRMDALEAPELLSFFCVSMNVV